MILVVEDQPADRLLLGRALMDLALYSRTSFASNGTEAMSLLDKTPETERPELIILDANLPRMSSQEFIQRIKADPRFSDIAVVVITGGISDEDKEELESLGALTVLEKPDTGDWGPLLREALGTR